MYKVNLLDLHTEEIVRTSKRSFSSYEEAECWGKEECNQFPMEISFEVIENDIPC